MDLNLLRLIRSILIIVVLITFTIVGVSIYLLTFHGLEINIQVIDKALTINENFYSGIITIIISLIALALPLSVNAITANQDKRFANNEMAESFYRNKNYRAIKYSVILLIILMITSYFKEPNIYLTITLTITVIAVLLIFIRFMKTVEEYVSNFPSILIREEREKIKRILRG
jgi:hypothetical protein